jgi:hypothetical protein
LSPSSLTFTPGNWSTPQTVTVTGQDGDNFDDGDVPYQVLATAASGDAQYNSIPVAPVSLTNRAVNNPPTLSAIADVTMNEDDLPLTLPLTGISDGQAGENQSLTVVLSSSDPTIITVSTSYVSPSSTGSFTLTPQPNANGVVTITATVTDSGGTAFGGSNTFQRTFIVTVNSVNDVPQVTVVPGGIVVNRGATVPITYRGPAVAPLGNGDPVNGAIGATDVETAPQLLVYQVQLIPSQGTLKKSGVPLTPNQTFTQQELNDGLITYSHNNGTGASDGFAFVVLDDNLPIAGVSALTVLNITINLGQLPPQVVVHPLQGTPPANFTFTEGMGPQPIDPAAIVFDQDSPNFGGGSITFSLTGPAPATPGSDIIGIQNQGTGPGQIGISGSQITYGGAVSAYVIGNISPTANGVGTDLAISFTSLATNTEAQALLRAITYFNGSDAPTAVPRVNDTRTLSVVMDDGTGSLSTSNLASISSMPIVVVPVNDPPTLANAAVLTFEGIPVDGVAVPTDLDGDPVTVSIATIPVKGTVTVTNPATGAFHYVPFPGKSGTDTFTLVVGDGLATSAPATVTVTVTGGADPRPWVASDPPLEVLANTILSYTVDVDSSDLASAPNLSFALEGAPPAGMTITPIPGTSTAIVLWNAVVIPGSDYVDFGVLVTDPVNNAAGYQHVLIKIVPTPGGGG